MTDKEYWQAIYEAAKARDRNTGKFTENPYKRASDADKLKAEIERLKDDYAKLQELFAQYQIASDKEIMAQKKEAEKRFENNMKAVLEIEKKQAVKEFAENLKTRFEEKEQHYICMYDWDGHSAVVDCANEVDELIKEYENADKD